MLAGIFVGVPITHLADFDEERNSRSKNIVSGVVDERSLAECRKVVCDSAVPLDTDASADWAKGVLDVA